MLAVLIMAAAVGCGKKAAEPPTPFPTATPTATAVTQPTGETGTLSNLQGDVQVLRSGASAWIAATSGMRIGTGDGLKTGDTGYVLITFFDGSVMEVEANSEISIEELSKSSGGSTTVHINQAIGNTINRVENLVDSSSSYEVETLAGSAVVRGTTERIQVSDYGRTCTSIDDEGDAAGHSAVFTGAGVAVDIVEGMTSCCEPGGIPGTPFYTDPNDDPLQNVTGDGGGGSEPQCAPGCFLSMIDNGDCDEECYNQACNWDGCGYPDGERLVLLEYVIIDGDGECDCSGQEPICGQPAGGTCEYDCEYGGQCVFTEGWHCACVE